MESEPPYQYVGGNVVNVVDPSGLCPPGVPACRGADGHPIDSYYRSEDPVSSTQSPPPSSYPSISAYVHNKCTAPEAGPGYAEGSSGTFSGLFAVEGVLGIEVVYDFATMERGLFKYEMEPLINTEYIKSKGATTALIEGTYMEYGVNLDGFAYYKTLADAYSARFVGVTVGAGLYNIGGAGAIYVDAPEDESGNKVYGSGAYKVGGPSVSPSILGPVSASVAATNYTILGTSYLYAEKTGRGWRVSEKKMREMQNHIRNGKDTPWGVRGRSLFNQAGYIAERDIAIKELEAYWEAYRDYFLYEYLPPQPSN